MHPHFDGFVIGHSGDHPPEPCPLVPPFRTRLFPSHWLVDSPDRLTEPEHPANSAPSCASPVLCAAIARSLSNSFNSVVIFNDCTENKLSEEKRENTRLIAFSFHLLINQMIPSLSRFVGFVHRPGNEQNIGPEHSRFWRHRQQCRSRLDRPDGRNCCLLLPQESSAEAEQH